MSSTEYWYISHSLLFYNPKRLLTLSFVFYWKIWNEKISRLSRCFHRLIFLRLFLDGNKSFCCFFVYSAIIINIVIFCKYALVHLVDAIRLRRFMPCMRCILIIMRKSALGSPIKAYSFKVEYCVDTDDNHGLFAPAKWAFWYLFYVQDYFSSVSVYLCLLFISLKIGSWRFDLLLFLICCKM